MYVTTHRRMLLFFFFNDTATTEIYTLSLHDALPIYFERAVSLFPELGAAHYGLALSYRALGRLEDRKSTRLNSSHSQISYAVFCLKKKKPTRSTTHSAYSTNPISATTPLR